MKGMKPVYMLFLLLQVLAGCMKDDVLWNFDRLETVRPNEGIFIVNEGNFTYNNASLSYYDLESGEIMNDVFFHTNALPLGDVAFSMNIRDSLGYVVMNNSGRIYVLNTSTFSFEGKITGLTSPRHIHFVSDSKAYVSDLYARAISIVDLDRMEICGSIDLSHPDGGYLQHPTEEMLSFGSLVYTNCWSFDNQVLVIDTERDQVVDSIRVLKQPNSMVMDRYGSLWILCDGGFPGSPYGYDLPGLLKVAAGEKEARIIHRFEEGDSPTELSINSGGDSLYFLNRHVFRMRIDQDQPEAFIQSPYNKDFQGGFYGLDVDPASSEIYVSDAIDYVQRGRVYRYASDGTLLDSLRVGISPGSFCFKKD